MPQLLKSSSLAYALALSCLLIVFGNEHVLAGSGAATSQQSGPVQELPVEPLSVATAMGNFDFDVEIADEPEERSIGLMNRKHMEIKHGMLFEFGRNETVTMWMKNTYLPLDMVFIRADGTVARIAERTTPQSETIISSGEPVTNVLELNAGVAKMIGLKKGDQVRHRLFSKP